jgi:hypothetical protein
MKLCPKCQKPFSDDANFCPVDAARLVLMEGQPDAAAADPLTQRFQLGPALGGSRTGAVHQAVDAQTGAAAVVKIISPDVVALPGVSQRIERELKQLERVQSVGVARVLASGRRGEDWWVATDLVEGAQTLAEAITARGPIPLEQAAHLAEVIGEALIEAAQVGVVHRDLAPKNVLFAGSDIKLINFSVPVPAEPTPGVPEFVAPEQVEGKAVDQRSNLYSLGALYYYVLTGQTVHSGTPEEVHRAHVSGTIAPPSTITEVPAPVEAVIMRALDRSPTKRFLTVRQFVDEVARVARGAGDDPVKSTQPMGRAGRPKAELVQTLLGVRGGDVSQAIMAASMRAAVAAHAAAKAAGGGGVVALPGVGAAPAPGGGGAAPAPEAAAAAPASSAPVPFVVPGSMPALRDEPHPASTMQGVGSSAGVQQPPVEAPPMGAPVAVAPQGRSPWAAPDAAAAAADPAAAAAPAPAQPQSSPAPAPAPAAAARKESKKDSKDDGKGDSKGKFRETLWFKKGDLDAQAAAEAAEARERTGRDTGAERADSLPMDERYKDDGSLSRGDKEKYSLRTGGTQAMKPLRERAPHASGDVSEDELIGEMKAGRGKILALIGVAVIVLILIIVLVAT